MTRADRITAAIVNTQAAEDGQLETFIAENYRFLAVEYSSGDPVFAMTAETLDEIAQHIDDSESQRDDVTIFDVETGDEWKPQFKTTIFLRTKGKPGKITVTTK
jgi:hypothetical protein